MFQGNRGESNQNQAVALGKREHFKTVNSITSSFLSQNKNMVFSTRSSELAERKLISNMSNKIKIFWKKYNNTYPFTFKESRLETTQDQECPLLLIERHQYNFKRVNPNQGLFETQPGG